MSRQQATSTPVLSPARQLTAFPLVPLLAPRYGTLCQLSYCNVVVEHTCEFLDLFEAYLTNLAIAQRAPWFGS